MTRLHENVVWGMRGNFVDVPTDCPQRDERLGWTGDLRGVRARPRPSSTTPSGMLRSWLADLAVEQVENDGVVPIFVPFPPIQPPGFPPLKAEAGWGDAAVVVPWVLYERHGDAELLADQWDEHDRLAGRLRAARRRGAWTSRTAAFMFGDWLDTAAPPDNPAAARTPWPCVATAYLARSARIMAQAADVLGRDGSEFADLAERAAERFRAEYVTPSGRLAFPSQTAYALALEFDLLLPGAAGATPGGCWPSRSPTDGFHIATGFLGTPFVTDALTNAGELATAYELLLQRENPSWLYPVTMGATTIWERWDSMLPGRVDQPRRDDVVQPLRVRRGGRLAAPHGRRASRRPRRATGGCGSRRVPDRVSRRPPPRTRRPTARRRCRLDVGRERRSRSTSRCRRTRRPRSSLPDGSAPFEVGSGRHSFAVSIPKPQPVAKPKPFWAPPE